MPSLPEASSIDYSDYTGQTRIILGLNDHVIRRRHIGHMVWHSHCDSSEAQCYVAPSVYVPLKEAVDLSDCITNTTQFTKETSAGGTYLVREVVHSLGLARREHRLSPSAQDEPYI